MSFRIRSAVTHDPTIGAWVRERAGRIAYTANLNDTRHAMPVAQPLDSAFQDGRQLLRLSDFSQSELETFTHPEPAVLCAPSALRGTMAMLFEQPSLRTASSFAAAATRVGLAPVAINARGHELRAGCDLADELHQLSITSDCVVVRCSQELDAGALAHCRGLLLNAGDGANEHPTQALIDLTTLRQLGLHDKRIVLMGNLRDHRTHHSLLAGLKAFGAQVTLVAPPGMAMAPRHAGLLTTLETADKRALDDVLASADAVYMTPAAYWDNPHEATGDAYRLDLNRALRVLKRNAKVLHPFPRHGELDVSLDNTPFDAYHQQIANAVAVRTRLLNRLLP